MVSRLCLYDDPLMVELLFGIIKGQNVCTENMKKTIGLEEQEGVCVVSCA